jgi:hypothetical protein
LFFIVILAYIELLDENLSWHLNLRGLFKRLLKKGIIVLHSIDLQISFISRYYFLKNDFDRFQDVYAKIQSIIEFVNPNSKYCGVIDKLDDCDETDIVIIIGPPDSDTIQNGNNVLLLIINVEDTVHSKFLCLHNLLTHNLVENGMGFSSNLWKKYIQLHGKKHINDSKKRYLAEINADGSEEYQYGRQYKNDARRFYITDSLYLRKFSQDGLLSYIPMLKKTEEWKTRDHFYGHPGGYPIEYPSLKTEVNKILPKLSDTSSKEVYHTVMCGSPVKIWKNYFYSLLDNPQYFDYVKLNENSVVITAGVESGFELPYYLSFNVKHIYCIDPCGKRKLGQYTKAWCENFPEKLTFIEKVLYKFETNCVLSSESEKGLIWNDPDIGNKSDISSVTLLQIIEKQKIERIDLIKTDLEGAERNMFNEIGEIVKRFRPQLAISIYHTLNFEDRKKKHHLFDMVNIPSKLIEVCDGYDFYIRCYSYQRQETIMYCIPK